MRLFYVQIFLDSCAFNVILHVKNIKQQHLVLFACIQQLNLRPHDLEIYHFVEFSVRQFWSKRVGEKLSPDLRGKLEKFHSLEFPGERFSEMR